VINSQLYVAGGWNGLCHELAFHVRSAVEYWTVLAGMSHMSACGASGVINSKLYVTTAVMDTADTRTIWTCTIRWPTRGPACRVGERARRCGRWGDQRQAIRGGRTELQRSPTNVMEVYDPAANSWTTIAPMKTAVQAAASVALNGELYVIGAWTPQTLPWRRCRFTTLHQQMEDRISLPFPRAARAAWWSMASYLMWELRQRSTNAYVAIEPSIP